MQQEDYNMSAKIAIPAIIIALLVTISLGVIAIGHVLENKPLVFLDYMDAYGLDYADFYQASKDMVAPQ